MAETLTFFVTGIGTTMVDKGIVLVTDEYPRSVDLAQPRCAALLVPCERLEELLDEFPPGPSVNASAAEFARVR